MFRCFSEDQIAFEEILNSRLRENFLKQNQTRSTAKATAEQILIERQELKAQNNFWKRVKFGETYTNSFCKRYDWKWSVQKGSQKYFPRKIDNQEYKKEMLNTECNVITECNGRNDFGR